MIDVCEDVERNPEREENRLDYDEAPTAHHLCELVGDTLPAAQFLGVKLIDVLDRWMAMAVTNSRPFPFFYSGVV
jgi:hypothetical protein